MVADLYGTGASGQDTLPRTIANRDASSGDGVHVDQGREVGAGRGAKMGFAHAARDLSCHCR